VLLIKENRVYMKYIIFLILLISFPQSFADGVISVAKPVGEIITTSSSTCPSGSLSADGAPISRSNYANLFQAMGIAYGPGDGSTTFNVPDYRGRFLRSADESGIRNPSGALAVGTAQNQATAKNSLSLSDPGHNHIDGWAGVFHLLVFPPMLPEVIKTYNEIAYLRTTPLQVPAKLIYTYLLVIQRLDR
jgi:hypothetical protein